MRFSVLYLGSLELHKNDLVEDSDKEQKIPCLIPAILIQHPTLGNVLYDTGLSPFSNTEHSKTVRERFPVTHFISIEQALEEKGLHPSDIDLLILSHLHFDHAGGLKYFRGTRAIRNVVISRQDLQNAYWRVMTGDESAYCRRLFDVEGIQFQTISGEVPLADDLILFTQRCHTPGVIGMVLKTAHSGVVIVTGDTLYQRENYERRISPGGISQIARDAFPVNLERISELEERYRATLFFGHDEKQIREWAGKGWIS